MGQMIPITRTECSAAELRLLLAVALILDGRSRTEAAEQGGMQQRQTLRDWVHRYNEAGVDGLKSRTAPGPARC